jgi:putative transposase
MSERKAMIDRTHDLPVVQQCKILSLSRSTAYYKPQESKQADLALMRRIDELHLEYPFAGSRMLRDLLRRDGFAVGRKHVATLMKKMNIAAVYKKPNTSRRHPAHLVYPYLLWHMEIMRPNHVFAADVTYIPMKRGFVYLFAVMDWASRRVLAWRLSNTLTTDFCIQAVQEAIHRYGTPEIFNTDQGSQFTSMEFTQLLNKVDLGFETLI